ncbi:MAG: pyridoxal phosphate-dependent aminotransferase [Myxococcota bacterium]
MGSRKAERMKPFIAMDVMERAHQIEAGGADVIHLEIGEPDFDTPGCVVEAAVQALREGKTHYTDSLGIPALREAVAADTRARTGRAVDPGRVIITSGSSPAMLLLFAMLLEPGDEVILSDPHYACYPNFITFFDAVPALVPVRAEEGFLLDPDAVRSRINRRTRAILINSPANPTGAVLPPDRLAALAALGPPIISDEVYHGLVYEGEARSALEFSEDAYILNGFSKRYAMTGWRLGYVIVPPESVRAMQKLQQSFFISANSFVQWAGVTALRKAGSELEGMRATYARRRPLLIDGLRALGFGIPVSPTGAFYVFANARHLDPDSRRLGFDLLEHARVGATPGVDFGPGGEGFLRFSYSAAEERIREAMGRLDRYLRERGSRRSR